MQDDKFTFTNDGAQVIEDEKFALKATMLVCKDYSIRKFGNQWALKPPKADVPEEAAL